MTRLTLLAALVSLSLLSTAASAQQPSSQPTPTPGPHRSGYVFRPAAERGVFLLPHYRTYRGPVRSRTGRAPLSSFHYAPQTLRTLRDQGAWVPLRYRTLPLYSSPGSPQGQFGWSLC